MSSGTNINPILPSGQRAEAGSWGPFPVGWPIDPSDIRGIRWSLCMLLAVLGGIISHIEEWNWVLYYMKETDPASFVKLDTSAENYDIVYGSGQAWLYLQRIRSLMSAPYETEKNYKRCLMKIHEKVAIIVERYIDVMGHTESKHSDKAWEIVAPYIDAMEVQKDAPYRRGCRQTQQLGKRLPSSVRSGCSPAATNGGLRRSGGEYSQDAVTGASAREVDKHSNYNDVLWGKVDREGLFPELIQSGRFIPNILQGFVPCFLPIIYCLGGWGPQSDIPSET